ncbi:unnamed protein product [Brachionus calyciflorus]|nr:unnamed protein product [Brachionus calyciflorus]
MKLKRSNFRVKCDKDRSLYPVLETKLTDWITEKREAGGCISRFVVRQKAIEIRITTGGPDLPQNTIGTIKQFFNDCQNLVNKSGFKPSNIVNMDETTIYLDFPSNYTYALKGSKRVKATTSGNERTRL